MNKFICITAVSHMRREATHKAEIVSQLLLGETAELLDETKDFFKLKCLYDGYEGWCQKSQITELINNSSATHFYINEAVGVVEVNEKPCRVSLATPYFKENIIAKNFKLHYPEQNILNATEMRFNEENIKYQSYKYLNTPYLWGGKSVFGIDCSGFAQQVFKMFNIFLMRDAYQQAEQGDVVGFLQQAQCGDLAFFDNDEGRIVHVGILLNNQTIIHSAGRVRIDVIDNAGIINTETGERTHQLRIIKRINNR
ncbi:MAG: C40 family peptidase [Bacteroidetes bacterium]|nr:C40 family peptidase [Bacteroidota bacterium]MBS1649658.1 C40 family peptidase [Bacteroidota bacterium]